MEDGGDGVIRKVSLKLSHLKGRKGGKKSRARSPSDQALQLFMAVSFMEPRVDRLGSRRPINIPTPASL